MPQNNKRKRIMLFVIGAIALGFLLLTAFVFFFPMSVIDKEFSEEVQEHHNQFLDIVMKSISEPGYMPFAPIMVVGTSAAFLLARHKKEAMFLLCTMLSAVVSSAVKLVINRPRPAEPLVRILVKTQQQSFPSGHVLFYVVFFGFLILLMYEIKGIANYIKLPVSIVSLFFIFSIPYSRVYLGAHWFTDVTAGFLLGLLCLYLLSVIYLRSSSSKKL